MPRPALDCVRLQLASPEQKRMRVPDDALDLIARWEGFERSAYTDAVGIPTIGYGFTESALARVGKPMPKVISRSEADQLLGTLVEEHYAPAILEHVQTGLETNELGALCSFVYNVGVGAFSDSTLLERLNSGDKAGAAQEFGKWIYAGDQVLEGLVRRRAEERRYFEQEERAYSAEEVDPIACRRVERIDHDFDFEPYVPDRIDPHA